MLRDPLQLVAGIQRCIEGKRKAVRYTLAMGLCVMQRYNHAQHIPRGQHMTNSQQTPAQTLITIRIMWAAMLFGVVAFTCIAAVMGPIRGNIDSDPDLARLLFYISLAMLLAGVGVGIFLRGQIFKKGWEGDVIKPGAYFSGTLLAIAALEGPSLFGAVALMLSDQLLPAIVTPILGIVLIALCFPTGLPMRPHSPKLGNDNPYEQR